MKKTGNRIIAAFLLIAAVLLPYTSFAATEGENGRIIDPDQPMIALTFDDGPSAEYTSAILDTLEANHARATFFVLGTEAEKNKELLLRMEETGNQIGNHTFNHPDLTKLTDEDLYYQMNTTQEIVRNATGAAPLVMRPPYGFMDDRTSGQIDLPVIRWSLDTRDWENRDAQMILDNILNNVKDGDVILMHDIYGSTAEAVKVAVPELIQRGYQLVTVSELSEYRGVALQGGEIYSNFYK